MISMFDLFPSCAIQSKIRLNAFSVTYIYQWIVLSERVFAILLASAYQFHQHSIWSIRILIVSTIIFWCIINGIYLDGYYDEYNKCQMLIPLPIYLGAALNNIIISCSIMSVLSRKLLLVHLKTEGKSESNDELVVVIRKSVILSLLAIISTQCSMALSVVVGINLMWISLDMMINAWCIMLMFSFHNRIYSFCCDCVSNQVSIGCIACCSCDCFCKVLSMNDLDKPTPFESVQSTTK
eukprot:282713_1